MYNVDLTGKVAVVTGGSRGLGLFIAEALHDVGAAVAITGRDVAALEHAREEIGEGCHAFPCDQRDAEAVRRMAEAVLERLGPVDILVNNAATVFGGANVTDMSVESWDLVVQTNLSGVFYTTRAFLPAMIERERGDIFMISSTSGKKGDPGMAAYAATKFGLQGFSQALQYEVRKHNVRVMVLNPSSVNTGPDTEPTEGPGLRLHAADLAATIVHLCGLPRRTLVRDMEVWGTNP